MTTETPTEPLPLTARQREVLEWIKANMAYYSPTVREIAAAFDFKSPQGAVCHLDALAKKGYVRLTGKARGIEVIHGR